MAAVRALAGWEAPRVTEALQALLTAQQTDFPGFQSRSTGRGTRPRRRCFGGAESACPGPRNSTPGSRSRTHYHWRATGEPACRPGSVRPLSRAGGHPSGTAVAGRLVRSTREHRAGRPRTLAQAPRPEERGALLTLLQVGFTKPPGSLQALVVSSPTVSPLPATKPKTWPRAVCFLWHYPAGHPGSALPTTLPCGARTFLTGSWNP